MINDVAKSIQDLHITRHGLTAWASQLSLILFIPIGPTGDCVLSVKDEGALDAHPAIPHPPCPISTHRKISFHQGFSLATAYVSIGSPLLLAVNANTMIGCGKLTSTK